MYFFHVAHPRERTHPPPWPPCSARPSLSQEPRHALTLHRVQARTCASARNPPPPPFSASVGGQAMLDRTCWSKTATSYTARGPLLTLQRPDREGWWFRAGRTARRAWRCGAESTPNNLKNSKNPNIYKYPVSWIECIHFLEAHPVSCIDCNRVWLLYASCRPLPLPASTGESPRYQRHWI